MKVFSNLDIIGHNELLFQFIINIENILDNGWQRNVDREEDIRHASPEPMFCFACKESETRPAAELWLAFKRDDNLYVSNIIPQKLDDLTYDQYNQIIREFYNHFSSPVAGELGLEVILTSSEKDLQNWMSHETAQKLVSFSNTANKSTGSSHPSDQRRWFDFLVSIFKEGSDFDSNILNQWLLEEGNWPPESANRLSIEFEFAMSFLSFYEESE